VASTIQDLVVMVDGSSVNGEVLVKEFTLKLKYGTLKLKKKEILAVDYKNPPFADTDEVQVSAGTRLKGDLHPVVVPVRFESTTQVIDLPKADIRSLVFFLNSRALSKKAKAALKSVA